SQRDLSSKTSQVGDIQARICRREGGVHCRRARPMHPSTRRTRSVPASIAMKNQTYLFLFTTLAACLCWTPAAVARQAQAKVVYVNVSPTPAKATATPRATPTPASATADTDPDRPTQEQLDMASFAARFLELQLKTIS